MKRRAAAVLVTVSALFGATTARAQDTLPDGPRAEQLRQLIEDRFAERLNVELGLTPEQSPKVRGILAGWAAKRRVIEQDERRLRQQLAGSMRPGVAANEAGVAKLTDNILSSRVAYAQTFKDEVAELGSVLSPVQRAQYVLLRDRLLQRIQEVRNQRQELRQEVQGFRRNRLRP